MRAITMTPKQTLCIQCREDISADVAEACQTNVVVYRSERREAAENAGPRKVFVECPFCQALHEYRCSATRPDEAR
jgi:hypothetical protein